MLNLYNGEMEFDEPEIPDDISDSDEDDYDESNIANLLNMFDETERELIEEYERVNLGSQRIEQSSQTSE